MAWKAGQECEEGEERGPWGERRRTTSGPVPRTLVSVGPVGPAAGSPSLLHVAMWWTAGSKFTLGLLPLLLLPQRAWGLAAKALSLSYNFTVLPKASRGQPWCEVQGQVHEKTFVSYDCGSQEVKSLSLLGEEVKGTRAWQEQMEMLRDVGYFLRQQLLDLKLEKYTDRDPLPLQGRMLCQWRANGRTAASWQFGFQGQTFLRFDSKNGTWTVLHPGGRWMKEKWESDRHVTKFFWNISMGDCRSWLESFMVHWEKMLETTASPTVAAVNGQSRASVITPIAWVLLVTLTCSILIDL
uniref:MHC class I-like antigen recognition-like domain-containing protein n=1 Tax=Equus caballus TaxID=9796 RepID=F7C7I4_HORSE